VAQPISRKNSGIDINPKYKRQETLAEKTTRADMAKSAKRDTILESRTRTISKVAMARLTLTSG
jgi:hypothetical protein